VLVASQAAQWQEPTHQYCRSRSIEPLRWKGTRCVNQLDAGECVGGATLVAHQARCAIGVAANSDHHSVQSKTIEEGGCSCDDSKVL
jgi:hypothetical protein